MNFSVYSELLKLVTSNQSHEVSLISPPQTSRSWTEHKDKDSQESTSLPNRISSSLKLFSRQHDTWGTHDEQHRSLPLLSLRHGSAFPQSVLKPLLQSEPQFDYWSGKLRTDWSLVDLRLKLWQKRILNTLFHLVFWINRTESSYLVRQSVEFRHQISSSVLQFSHIRKHFSKNPQTPDEELKHAKAAER